MQFNICVYKAHKHTCSHRFNKFSFIWHIQFARLQKRPPTHKVARLIKLSFMFKYSNIEAHSGFEEKRKWSASALRGMSVCELFSSWQHWWEPNNSIESDHFSFDMRHVNSWLDILSQPVWKAESRNSCMIRFHSGNWYKHAETYACQHSTSHAETTETIYLDFRLFFCTDATAFCWRNMGRKNKPWSIANQQIKFSAHQWPTLPSSSKEVELQWLWSCPRCSEERSKLCLHVLLNRRLRRWKHVTWMNMNVRGWTWGRSSSLNDKRTQWHTKDMMSSIFCVWNMFLLTVYGLS